MAPEALLGHGPVEIDHPDRGVRSEECPEVIDRDRIRIDIRIRPKLQAVYDKAQGFQLDRSQ